MSDDDKFKFKTGNKLIDGTDWSELRKKLDPLGINNIPKYKYVRFNDLVKQPTPPNIFKTKETKTPEIFEKVYGVKLGKIDLKSKNKDKKP